MPNHENNDLPASQSDETKNTPVRTDIATYDEKGRIVKTVSFRRTDSYSFVYGPDGKLISSTSSANGSAG